jgi:hypothetical protein
MITYGINFRVGFNGDLSPDAGISFLPTMERLNLRIRLYGDVVDSNKSWD